VDQDVEQSDVGTAHDTPTRESANRIDNKITMTPVAKTSRSANKRRMRDLSRRSYSARNGI